MSIRKDPLGASASPDQPEQATLDAMIIGERTLLDGLHSAERESWRGTPRESVRHDHDRYGLRPHHYPILVLLRDHAIATDAPGLVQRPKDYPREFPWSPRDRSFDVWADAQILSRTRTMTGDNIKHWACQAVAPRTVISRSRSGAVWRHDDNGIDHAINMLTLLLAASPERARQFGVDDLYFVQAMHIVDHGFTRDWTDQMGAAAPVLWAAGITPAEYATKNGTCTGAALHALASLRGYRLPVI